MAPRRAAARSWVQPFDPSLSLNASIDVSYRHDPKLDMWVPSRMEGTYTRLAARIGSSYNLERLSCVAT